MKFVFKTGLPPHSWFQFFTFAAMCIYGTDIYFSLQRWRSSGEGPYICGNTPPAAPPATTAAHTTVTMPAATGPSAAGPPPPTHEKGPQY